MSMGISVARQAGEDLDPRRYFAAGAVACGMAASEQDSRLRRTTQRKGDRHMSAHAETDVTSRNVAVVKRLYAEGERAQ